MNRLASALAALIALGATSSPAAHLTYLDNGKIRLGLNLDMGGAISYLAKSDGGSNLINNWDFGREVQLSFYSGPVPFKPAGAKMDSNWQALGWNPIQAGDAFGHGARVTELKNNGKTIHLRCVPMIWPLNNVPAECFFDCTYRLSGNTVEVENHLLNHRSDRQQYPARTQELPAVYSNGAWYKLVSYTGNEPFIDAPTTTLVDLHDGKGWPWLGFNGTEHWAALVDRNNNGLGVFEPDVCHFGGGFAGKPKGRGGPKNDQTGYIAPNLDEILDYNVNYKFNYVLIVGSVDEIRDYAVKHSRPSLAPRWVFKSDRQHWTYENASDTGWPIRGELRVNSNRENAALLSPQLLWHAETAPTLEIRAAFQSGSSVSAFFETPDNKWVGPVEIPIQPDGKFHPYRADLRSLTNYRGPMTRVKIILPGDHSTARVRQIEFKN